MGTVQMSNGLTAVSVQQAYLRLINIGEKTIPLACVKSRALDAEAPNVTVCRVSRGTPCAFPPCHR